MVTILFGAGAEQCFGLSGGYEFAQSVLGINQEALHNAIKNFYSNITIVIVINFFKCRSMINNF